MQEQMGKWQSQPIESVLAHSLSMTGQAMIDNFRNAFATPALPFYWVQLAPYYYKPPDKNTFPHIRVAQAEVNASGAIG